MNFHFWVNYPFSAAKTSYMIAKHKKEQILYITGTLTFDTLIHAENFTYFDLVKVCVAFQMLDFYL